MSNITFRLTGGTHVGLVRTNNEDNFIVNPDLSQQEWFIPNDTSQTIELGAAGCLMVVADGMGGMNAGEVASAITIDTIKDTFSAQKIDEIIKSDMKIRDFLHDTVLQADRNIKKRIKEDKSTEGMGTTVVIAWIVGQKAHICWCGDSRAYLFNSKFGGIVRLSKDHSYVQQLVDEGKLDPDLAFDHPNSNIITRCLGDSNSKAKPDYVCRQLSSGDVILLCSDGLCGLCRDEEIEGVLNMEAESIEQYKNALINAALEAGGYDNVTITLFQVVEAPGKTADISSTHNDYEIKPKPKKKSRKAVKWITAIVVLIVAIVVGLIALLPKCGDSGVAKPCFVQTWFEDVKQKITDLFNRNDEQGWEENPDDEVKPDEDVVGGDNNDGDNNNLPDTSNQEESKNIIDIETQPETQPKSEDKTLIEDHQAVVVDVAESKETVEKGKNVEQPTISVSSEPTKSAKPAEQVESAKPAEQVESAKPVEQTESAKPIEDKATDATDSSLQEQTKANKSEDSSSNQTSVSDVVATE